MWLDEFKVFNLSTSICPARESIHQISKWSNAMINLFSVSLIVDESLAVSI